MIENLDKIPKVLYKYRSFDQHDYCLKYATRGEAYFASARDFNDPFENHFIPKSKLLELKGEALTIYLREKAFMHFPDASESKLAELIEIGKEQQRLLKNGDPRGFEAVLETQYQNFGILSLTAIPDSIPMWAYYCDSHKGLCIGLSTSKIAEHQQKLIPENQLLILHKVKYQNKMLEYCVDVGKNGMSKRDLELLERTLYTKSNSWKHEQEYRLLFYDQPSFTYTFGTDSVTEVIIGLRSSEENQIRLIDKLNAEHSDAKIRRVVMSRNKYKIEIEDLN